MSADKKQLNIHYHEPSHVRGFCQTDLKLPEKE